MPSRLKVASVVGARPQFIKLAPVHRAANADGEIDHLIIHTGQHYDPLMSDVFFEEFHIPKPDINLGVGSGTHGAQTGAMLSALEEVFEHHKPDWVLVYGDTNSTLAATLTAVKLHIPVSHLEAGLRSFNRRMPEEHNRVISDHAADLLLAPTDIAMENLRNEGLYSRAVKVGDVMADVCLSAKRAVQDQQAQIPKSIDSDKPYVIATIHRPENTDNEVRLRLVLDALRNIPVPVAFLTHPRLLARAAKFNIGLDGGALHPSGPLGYFKMVRAVMSSAGVVTDSGGLQKEAYLLGVPCTTLRRETEWVETLLDGWNILDADLRLVDVLASRAAPRSRRMQPYGDGDAAVRVVGELRARGGFSGA